MGTASPRGKGDLADLRSSPELLKAYRVAHSRVLAIEPFETALRENTPLTSIGEPKALTEYLNQMSMKSDMVVDELKRVSTERDDFKKKLDEAQQSARDAWDEVAGLKEPPTKEQGKSPNENKETSEEFFSFDTEIPRLEGELKEKQEEVATLKTEVEKLKKDLSVARESTEGMVQNLETSTRELMELRDTKDKLEAEIETLKESKGDVDDVKAKLATAESSLQTATAEAEKLKVELKEKSDEIEKLQAQASEASKAEKEEPSPELVSQLEDAKKEKEASEKKLGVVQGLVDNLRTQLKDTESTVSGLKAEISQKSESSSKFQSIVEFVDKNLKDNAAWQSAKEDVGAGRQADFEEIRKSLASTGKTAEMGTTAADEDNQPAAAATGTSGGGKKKNKKKKKGGKAAEES